MGRYIEGQRGTKAILSGTTEARTEASTEPEGMQFQPSRNQAPAPRAV
jgi:hypothetical protein